MANQQLQQKEYLLTYLYVSAMTMTTGWLLLLLMVLLHHNVNSQSTIDDQRCDGDNVELLMKLERDVEKLFQRQQKILDLLGKHLSKIT